jgi:hypothetical protein
LLIPVGRKDWPSSSHVTTTVFLDLLWRWRRAELAANIALVVSNHKDLRKDVQAFGVGYEHVPVERERKREAEARMLDLLRSRVDLVVLARYMRILSGDFLEQLAASDAARRSSRSAGEAKSLSRSFEVASALGSHAQS